MQKKVLFVTFTIWILLSLFYVHRSVANEIESIKDQKAFYAISSLKFHLDKVIDDISGSQKIHLCKIDFNEKEIDHLWFLASSLPSINTQIQEAQQNYEAALSQPTNPSLSCKLFQESQNILENVWRDLNPYIRKKKQKNLRYAENPYLTKEMLDTMRPYLLPLDDPLRHTLDAVCQSSRILENKNSFRQAGFITLVHQHKSLIRVARHPLFPGYLFKLYLDSDPPKIRSKSGWVRLVRRCEGAENIRQLIKKKKLVHFTVPDKWLYPPSVSQVPPATPVESVQPVILIVTDMDIVSPPESYEAWKTKITPSHLDELYCIISHGFASAFLAYNIPYCKNGKFACIDTEYPKRTLGYDRVRAYFSPEMQLYWDELVKTGGKPR
jgi:hypothetical protein